MIKKSTRRIAVLFLISDLVSTLAALVAAYALRFRAEIVPVTKGVPDAATYYRLFPLIAVLWPIVYYFYGLYSVSRHRSRIEEGFAVLVATGLATLLLTGLATFFRGFFYSRLVLAVIDKLAEHPEAGLRAVAMLDDDPQRLGELYRGIPVAGPTSQAAAAVEQLGVDTVFLALPLEAHRTMLEVLKEVGRTVADVRVVPDLLQHITFRAGVEDLDGLPVVHLTQVPLSGWMSLVKRTVDLFVSSTALAVLDRKS